VRPRHSFKVQFVSHFPRGVKGLESLFLNGFDQVLKRFVAKQEEMLGVCEI
jgi:hypothetical protein